MSGPPDRTGLRAGDADRERVAEVLRAAAVDGRLDLAELDDRLSAAYRARTYGDLVGLTGDLPPELSDGLLPVVQPPSGSVDRAGADAGSRGVAGRAPAGPAVVAGPERGTVVALFSGVSRGGRWTVPERLAVVAVMGGADLDLRSADFAAPEVVLTVFALFGWVKITVPEGVNVRADGVGILGGFDGDGGQEVGPGAPTVVIRGVALFGGVEVKRRPAGRKRQRDRDRDRDRDLDPDPDPDPDPGPGRTDTDRWARDRWARDRRG